MLSLFKNKKAQAAVELAIIGSLIILAFSYLITFTAKVNIKQENLQNVFRNMLIAANRGGQSYANASAPLFERMPNILDPYAPGELTPIETSGSVRWSGGEAKDNTEVKTSARWSKGESEESGTYHKTFTRKEVPGAYPETNRTVDYWKPIIGESRSGP